MLHCNNQISKEGGRRTNISRSTIIPLLMLLHLNVICQNNIILQKQIIATNITGGTTAVSSAIDGNLSSALYVNATTNSYFIVDLGAIYSISKIKVTFGTKYPPLFRIHTSLDNTSYYQIINGDGFIGEREFTSFLFPNNVNQHRYIKFIFDPYYVGKVDAYLSELEISGTPCITFSYRYDAGGNRVSRTIIIPANSMKMMENDSIGQTNVSDKFEKPYYDNLAENRISIYPNPTQGQLILKIEGKDTDASFHVMIFDMNGKKVLQNDIKIGENCIVDLSNNSSGIYLLRIQGKRNISEWKIIKQ
ncbi:MAG: T9SS type A sorting domain-containing protein [Bacteroidales bacterium]